MFISQLTQGGTGHKHLSREVWSLFLLYKRRTCLCSQSRAWGWFLLRQVVGAGVGLTGWGQLRLRSGCCQETSMAALLLGNSLIKN